jgi:hypothetical protein
MMTDEPDKSRAKLLYTRRQLLRGLAAASVTAALAGCGVAATATPQAKIAPFPPWHPLLPSPQPTTPDAAAATPAPEGLPLAAFLALSALLTGIDNLNPQIGQTYLQSLAASDQFDVSLAELYAQAGFTENSAPAGIEELEARGLFEQEGTRALADKIIEYWYSGVYDTPDGEQAVATFADALVWQAVRYTKPLTLCGAPGFWAVPPEYAQIAG